jgi:hypothetical protein
MPNAGAAIAVKAGRAISELAKRAKHLAIAAVVSAIPGIGAGAAAAAADELAMPQTVERGSQVTAAYRFDKPATGRGRLDLEWSDVDGRVVERRRIPLDLADAAQVAFGLDMRRAVTVKNELAAHLSLDGVDRSGAPTHRRDDLVTSFIASPPNQAWWDYQIVMWQGQTPAAYDALKRLGVTAGMLEADHRGSGVYAAGGLAPLLDQDLRFYLENIATDFYSPYHKASGDRPVNWRFLAAEALHRENPDDLAAFIRDPSLSDPDWRARIRDRVTRDVRALHRYRPLYYSLGDETGIADLSSFWDFDFSAHSLSAMREWLKRRYGDVTALNRQWGSHFAGWDEIMPMTTRQAIATPDENFSAWADFKEWMDVAFADAVASGTAAVHAADPDALAAIEGAQIPGWGGYDYPRLAHSVDVIEPYDYDENFEMLRSFNPKLVLLTTAFLSGPQAAYRAWSELLRGTRGLILWDADHGFATTDGGLGARGKDAAPYFGEIRGGLGALLINSRRRTDPVAVLYSQASMRIDWLLDQRARGQPGHDGTTGAEVPGAEQSGAAPRISARNFVQMIEHMGLEPRFVAAAEVADGGLRDGGCRVLMLPQASALSPAEASAIRDFVAKGGVAIADGEPGRFDAHGKRAGQPLLADVFAGRPAAAATQFAFGNGKALYMDFSQAGRRADVKRVGEILAAAGVKPPFPVADAEGAPVDDVETRVFDGGRATILALQRDLSAAAPTAREAVVVALPRRLNVYDLRGRRALGERDRVVLALGPGEPAILALAPAPLAAPGLAGPADARLGDNVEFRIRLNPPETPGEIRGVIHVDIVGPDGRMVRPYSGNLRAAPGGEAVKLLPLAVNDKPGIWKIRATDVLSGQTATAELNVEP